MILIDERGDGQNGMNTTLPFVVVLGWNNVITRSIKTMRKCFGLYIGRIVKEK